MRQHGSPETPSTDVVDPISADHARWPVGRLLSAAARRVERDWNAHLSAWDLNHASLPVLVHLARGPLSQRQLATACEVTEQTTSRVVARLERSGYVTRAAHENDRRRLVLSITASGRAALAVAADHELAEAMVTRGLTPEQVHQLRRLLAIVARPDADPNPR